MTNHWSAVRAEKKQFVQEKTICPRTESGQIICPRTNILSATCTGNFKRYGVYPRTYIICLKTYIICCKFHPSILCVPAIRVASFGKMHNIKMRVCSVQRNITDNVNWVIDDDFFIVERDSPKANRLLKLKTKDNLSTVRGCLWVETTREHLQNCAHSFVKGWQNVWSICSPFRDVVDRQACFSTMFLYSFPMSECRVLWQTWVILFVLSEFGISTVSFNNEETIINHSIGIVSDGALDRTNTHFDVRFSKTRDPNRWDT